MLGQSRVMQRLSTLIVQVEELVQELSLAASELLHNFPYIPKIL
jgi:hypothetical protein